MDRDTSCSIVDADTLALQYNQSRSIFLWAFDIECNRASLYILQSSSCHGRFNILSCSVVWMTKGKYRGMTRSRNCNLPYVYWNWFPSGDFKVWAFGRQFGTCCYLCLQHSMDPAVWLRSFSIQAFAIGYSLRPYTPDHTWI
jgi:hypothetical protein